MHAGIDEEIVHRSPYADAIDMHWRAVSHGADHQACGYGPVRGRGAWVGQQLIEPVASAPRYDRLVVTTAGTVHPER